MSTRVASDQSKGHRASVIVEFLQFHIHWTSSGRNFISLWFYCLPKTYLEHIICIKHIINNVNAIYSAQDNDINDLM